MALRPGDIVDGKYRIEKVLGRGGMGTVYEAHHIAIRRRVAVKVLRGALAADEEMVHRFENEALAASSVRSRHVVEVYDVGTLDGGERYMILEYLDGESLSQRLKRGTMTPAEVFPLAAQLLEGLAAAHDEGIVHRDLKPANIFICAEERGEELVKVLDFGVSKFSALGGEGFTQTGALVGTPHYMAPELTEGASKADARSDIYGVGAILFRALTGKTPYTAETIHELIAKLIRHDPKRLANVAPQLSKPAATLVDRALSKDPSQRFPDARSMALALRNVMTDPSLLEVHLADEDGSNVGEAPPTPGPSQPSWREGRSRSPTDAVLGTLSASGRPGPGRVEESFAGATVIRPDNAPEPPTLVTPSPATLDSLAIPPKPRSKAWLVGVGIGAAVAVGAGALLLSGPDAGTVAPQPAASAPPPVANEAEPEPSSVALDPEPEPEPSSTAPAPPETAQPSPRPNVAPVVQPRPRSAPRVPAPAPPSPRDIREDL